MAQHDYNIENQTGLKFRADLNGALQAIATQNSGTTEPADTFPGMVWLDTSTSPPTERRRNQTDDGWVTTLTAAGQAVAGAADAAAQRAAMGAQATLVSGGNIKTINGKALLGSGDVVISTESVPAGCVAHFAMSSAPTGWLKANGALVSRTTYAALFAAIGTTFGVGDGSTTFALPDLRGEFLRGWDDGRGVDSARVLGSAQGGANAAHTHGAGTLAAASAGGHTHTIPYGGTYTGSGVMIPSNSGSSGNPAVSGSAGAHTHTISGTTASDGSEARPRNVSLLACIKF